MKRNIKNIIAGFAIIITWLNVIRQFIDVCGYCSDSYFYLNETIFNPQKLLFNNLLGIILCIYINTYDINRTEYVIRARKNILLEQVLLGCKICILYSMIILSFVILPLFISTSPIKVMVIFIQYWYRLTIFNFMIFSVFTFTSIYTKRSIALFLILSAGFILLVSWNIYSFNFCDGDSFFVTQNTWFHIGTIILMVVNSQHSLKKKEYFG